MCEVSFLLLSFFFARVVGGVGGWWEGWVRGSVETKFIPTS